MSQSRWSCGATQSPRSLRTSAAEAKWHDYVPKRSREFRFLVEICIFHQQMVRTHSEIYDALIAVLVLSSTCVGCAYTPAGVDAPVGELLKIAILESAGSRTIEADGIVELGDVAQAGQTTETLVLANESSTAITVYLAACSCECVTFGLPAEIEAGAQQEVALDVDLGREPDFVGELEVQVLLSIREASGAETSAMRLKIRFRAVPQAASPG